MRTFLLGLIVGLVLIPLSVWAYFRCGFAPVGTAAGAMPFEKYLARVALHTRLDKEAPKSSPLQGNEANYEAGAHVYREQCAVCHGLPNQPEPSIGAGEYPQPPQLFKGHGVTDDPVGETYWKVANGIRLTGMPAFNRALNQDQMWQVSLMLADADKLPETVRTELRQPLSTK